MDILKRVGFRKDTSLELLCYLQDNGIPYTEEGSIGSVVIGINSPHWPFVYDCVQRDSLVCLSETVYSKEELRKADWLRVRSRWRVGYPQPEAAYGYESITYDKANCCSVCGTGLEQVKPFQIKKVPRWGSRHFAELNWIGDELFVDDVAKAMLEYFNITGISFWPVKDKRGVDILPDIHQLYIPHILDEGLVRDAQSIRRTTKCAHCGRIKHLGSGMGMMEYKKEIFDGAPDAVKSHESFGDGYYSSREILVRANVYHAIVSKGIEKHLVFEPIKLV